MAEQSGVPPYRNRLEAGRILAEGLGKYAGRPDALVLALPRGGVPVAYEVARALAAPLDVFLVHKLGLPGHDEVAMGAVASGGARVVNQEVASRLRVPEAVFAAAAEREGEALEQREHAYRGSRPPADIRGRTVILVDDGLATGSTLRAAVAALRRQQPASIVVAVPIAAPSACGELSWEVDDIVCAETREPFYAVGLWYADYPEVGDEEIRALLARASVGRAAA